MSQHSAGERRHRAGLALAILAMALILPLAGCGKKGEPSAPKDQPDVFPRSYPRD